VVVLNREQAEYIRDHDAKGSRRADSPWQTHFEDMWIKSCVRRLRKWVPTSADIRDLLERAERVDSAPALRVDAEISRPRTVESSADDTTTEAEPNGGAATEAQELVGWPETKQPPA
jgi:recombination protein RecT